MTKSTERHVPVLFNEVMEFLKVRRGGTYVDCTLGLAGHAEGIVRRLGPAGHLIGFDRDTEALALAKARLDGVASELGSESPRITLVDEAFSSIARHVKPGTLDGLLADFGVSSLQFDEAHRGFSFQADGPLDSRMDTRSGPTAADVVNQANEHELADLIYELGEERRSRRIARAIVRGRPITATGQLARIVASAAPAMKTIAYTRQHGRFKLFVFMSIASWTRFGHCWRPHQSCLSLCTAGRHKFSFTGRPYRERQPARRRAAGDLGNSYQEAGYGERRRDGSQPAFAQREAESGGKNRD